MKIINEIQRIKNNNNLEMPNGKKVIFTISAIKDANTILNKVKEVISIQSKTMYINSEGGIELSPEWFDKLFDQWSDEIYNKAYIFEKKNLD